MAENILRVELQASYQFIQSICKCFGIERDFGSLFDYKIALMAIESAFKRVFRLDTDCDFYTYQAAKVKAPKGAAQETLYSIATNHNVAGKKYDYGRKKLKQCGIYPFCLLPHDCPTDMLKSPCRMVKEKNLTLYVDECRVVLMAARYFSFYNYSNRKSALKPYFRHGLGIYPYRSFAHDFGHRNKWKL